MFKVPQTPVAYISNLAVATSHRHQGIAQALLHRCERQVRDWNRSMVYLHVQSSNYSALSLYRKLGHRETSDNAGALSLQRTLLAKPVQAIADT